MKKYLAVVSLAVLSLFVIFAAFGADVKAARAEDGGEDGVQVQAGVSAGLSAGDAKDQAEHQADQLKNEAEHQADQQKNEAEHQADQQKNEADDELEMEQEDSSVNSTSSLELSIKHRESELDAEASSTEDNNKQEALKNQNEVRLAVHALLSSKALLGGIGPQVSDIAQSLNGSVTSTIAAETKISSRGWLARLFFGGDQATAQDLLNQTNQNQQDIQRINELITSCTNCSPDLKTLLQDRLDVALAEQARLQAMAKAEIDSRGIFNVLFGWLQK